MLKSKKNKSNRKNWKTISTKIVLKTPWLAIKKNKVSLPSGKIINDFYTIDGNTLVAVLAVNEKKQILITEQYRYAVNKKTIDIPGGAVSKGESALQAAKREFKEETGYSALSLSKIFTYYPDSGRSNVIKYIFLTHIDSMALSKNILNDETELITTRWVSISKLLNNTKDLEPTLLLALLYYNFLLK